MTMTCWREGLYEAAKENNEAPETLICTLDDAGLDKQFDDGFGGSDGADFTAWGKDWVYFPVVYDGAEWVGCAPRNPCDIATKHQGGE